MSEKNQNENKIVLLAQLIENAQDNLNRARLLLKELGGDDLKQGKEIQKKAEDLGKVGEEGRNKIIEGVFNGENMVGPDGKIYNIPANYVSKSKLVEGDILKLTITADGSFLYKQIGPVKRKRLVGTLIKDDMNGEYRVSVANRSYKVITAAVTYFKGEPGDEAIILTSLDGSSKYAALENIVKRGEPVNKLSENSGETSQQRLAAGLTDAAKLPSGDKDSLLNNSILEEID